MTKIYIVYDKDTKEVKGNEHSLSTAQRKIEEDNAGDNEYFELAKQEGKIIRDYRNCEVEEIENEEWKTHIKSNPEVSKIKNKKLKTEKKVKTLDELKKEKINPRKSYLKNQFEEWYCDMENMPIETKNKIIQTKQEIKEIELIENEQDLENYNNF